MPASAARSSLSETRPLCLHRVRARDRDGRGAIRNRMQSREQGDHVEALKGLVRTALAARGREYAGVCEATMEAMQLVREEARSALQPVINSHLKQQAHSTFAEKKALASSLNAQLQVLGLAIKCPHTGHRPFHRVSGSVPVLWELLPANPA